MLKGLIHIWEIRKILDFLGLRFLTQWSIFQMSPSSCYSRSIISMFIPPWLLISPDLCYCALLCRLIWYCFIIKGKTLSVFQKTNSSALVSPMCLFLAEGAVLWIWVTFSICGLAAGRRSLESGCQGLCFAPASGLSSVHSVTGRHLLTPTHALAPLHPDALHFFSQLPKGW